MNSFVLIGAFFLEDRMAQKPLSEKLDDRVAYSKGGPGAGKKKTLAEEALRESESKYRDLVETSNDWVWEIDPEGYYTYASPKVKNLFGYTPEEVIGKTPFDLMFEEDIERITEFFKDMTKKQAPFTIPENRYIHKDGSLLVLEISGVPIFDSKGILAGWRGLVHDITERKRAEDAIRKSEERLTNVHLAINDGIWEWDVWGDRVIYASDRFAEIMGYESMEHQVLEALRKTSLGEAVLDVEYKYRNAENKYIWINVTGVLISNGEKTENKIVGSIRDITNKKMAEKERRELQAKLQQAQKMEAIGTLAGGIAHDFNNLLQSIIINTELGLYELKDEGIDTKRLEQIFKASTRAKDLVRQIVTFSRQSEKPLGPLRLSPLVKESLKLLRSTLPATIEVRQSIMAGKDTILADPTQINQILMNLCTNAAHAMKQGGGVLEVSLIDVALTDDAADINAELSPGDYVILKVSDTGYGMDQEVMERIFDPFFTTKGPAEGSGMGLSVVHGIVKGCNGTIVVDSKPEKGATFQIFFPYVEEKVELIAKESAPLPVGNERILLVDDEMFILESLKAALENLGYTVVASLGSNKALETFSIRPEQFDIVITDHTMPHMTGVELAKKFMSIRPGLPIILCTGFSDMITEEDAKAIGISGFFMKPLVTNEIANTIRRVLDAGK
jgi:PAS domain S-box-containing protein